MKNNEEKVNITTEWVDVTPEMAAELLKTNNEGNRKITKAASKFITEQMKEGAWKITGETIQISDQGRLIDGQHRLFGVIRSNTTQKFLIVKGVPDANQTVIDTGKSRTAGDVLYMHGIPNHTIAAAIIKKYLRLLRSVTSYGGDKRYIASNDKVLEVYNSRPRFYASITLAAQTWYKESNHLISPSEIGGIYTLMLDKVAGGRFDKIVEREESVEEIEAREARGEFNEIKRFFDKLFLGIGLDINTTVYVFRQQLNRIRINKLKYNSTDFFILFVMTWNDYLEGRFRRKLVVPKSGKVPSMKTLSSEQSIEFAPEQKEDKKEKEREKVKD
ncbi:MAG: hypothetical protein AAF620_00355 [Bacteroidota bacterium]